MVSVSVFSMGTITKVSIRSRVRIAVLTGVGLLPQHRYRRHIPVNGRGRPWLQGGRYATRLLVSSRHGGLGGRQGVARPRGIGLVRGPRADHGGVGSRYPAGAGALALGPETTVIRRSLLPSSIGWTALTSPYRNHSGRYRIHEVYPRLKAETLALLFL
jgi:hypothetical protein